MDYQRLGSTPKRRQSLVEAAEKHFDTNSLILIVNVLILFAAMGLLYMVATSASFKFGSFNIN
uniref:Triple QxxK/R motif-containing protein n=1 Tax=Rhabditophanes sp. KR3021 TaxID=114890 RepID=A0AC35U639_9BILA